MSDKSITLVSVCYKVMDILTSLKSLVDEYDDGLPIIKNTSFIHKEIDSIRASLREIIEDVSSEIDEDTSSDCSQG